MKLSAILSPQGAAALVLSTLLGGCTVAVDEGPGYRPPRPEQRYCTREYEPVCARRGHDRQSFSNACLAKRAGYRIVGNGLCRGESDGGGKQKFCTREYRPVCARKRGSVRTFSNACEARAAEWQVVSNGRCRS